MKAIDDFAAEVVGNCREQCLQRNSIHGNLPSKSEIPAAVVRNYRNVPLKEQKKADQPASICRKVKRNIKNLRYMTCFESDIAFTAGNIGHKVRLFTGK
jgi:hypothetical protein